jgi:hypothetical protein
MEDNGTQKEVRHTSMSHVGFKPTIRVSEQAVTKHTLDCPATVISIRGVLENSRNVIVVTASVK